MTRLGERGIVVAGLSALLLAAGMVLPACGEEAQQAYREAKQEVGQALDEASDGVGEAVGEAGEAWDAAKGDLAEAGGELAAAWDGARGELGEAMTSAFAMFSASSDTAKVSLGKVVDKLEALKDKGVEMSAIPGQLLDSPEWKQLVADAGGAWDRLGLSLGELKDDPQLSQALDAFLTRAKSALND